jgi:aspartyl-tRNA synthetase
MRQFDMETSVPLDFLGELRRTHMCGAVRATDVGKTVVLMGWVHKRRDHGGVIFVDLRDREGIAQVVFHEDAGSEVHQRAELVRPEYVIAVEGKVEPRGAGMVNPNLATGEVEVVAQRIWILNESRTPPFPVEDEVGVSEDVRLKYRYVDLRRPRMQHNIVLRSKIAMAVRQTLWDQGFLEIETPFMTRSTPEGARDYLVPCRVQPGTFYALPQSPQIFKQILMVSGFDKYFQIVRCFRDEDFRADRQAEFTQIDLEMSFPQQERVFETIEPLIERVCEVAGFTVKAPFPRLTYAEAMRSYGIDKPDRRIPPMHPVEDLLPELAANGLPLVAIHVPAPARPAARTRRTEGLRTGARPARLRRRQAHGSRLSRADGQSARALRRRRERSADVGRLGRRAQGPSSRRDGVPGLRPIAPAGRAEVQRPPQAARSQESAIPLGGRLPHVRMGRGRRPLERRPSPLHVGAR